MGTTRTKAVAMVGALATALLAGSCTTKVGGTAQPPPATHDPVVAGEPCALLEPEQTAELQLEEKGEFTAGDPTRLVPPTCRWRPLDPDMDALTVGFATSFPLVDYMDGTPSLEERELGGRTWGRYPDPLDTGTCFLATELSANSFIVVLSSNFSDDSKACDLALKAAPLISANLPGS